MKFLLLAALLFASCSPSPLTLEQVRDSFSKLPMKDAVVYDEKTDPNQLLGRPGRYIAKMNFTDERLPPSDVPNCTIEVFHNAADAENRRAYLESVGRGASFLDSYKFLHKNVLVRVDLGLTPSQAAEYETALKSLR